MKKIITIILLATIGLAVQANPIEYQGNRTPKKLVEKALKNGVSSMGTYTINNKSNEKAFPSEMMDYLRQNGYIPISSSEKRHSRFGEKISIVDKMEFIEVSNFQRYAFVRLKGNGGVSFNQLKGGLAFSYPEGFRSQHNATQSAMMTLIDGVRSLYSLKPQELGEIKKMSRVYWSGAVVDGYIDGHGVGMYENGDGWSVFEGDFDAGFPTQDFRAVTLSTNMRVSSTTFNAIDRGMILQVKPQGIRAYANNHYSSDAAKLEDLYDEALTLNNGGDIDRIQLPYADEFVSLYGSAGVDNKHIMPKAAELQRLNVVRSALGIFLNKSYTRPSLLYGTGFRKQDAQEDTALMGLACRIARQGSYDENNVFRPFYTNIYSVLRENQKSLYKNINRSIDYVNDNSYDLLAKASNSSSSSISSMSSSSSTSSSEVSESSEESSSSSSKRTLSCKVELVLPDGGHVVGRNVECWIHKSKWTDEGGYVKCWIDNNGKGTIEWEESRGDYIEKIVNICQFGKCYHIDDVELKPGGDYKLKAVEN